MPPLRKPVCLTPREIENRLLSARIQPTAQRIAICRFVLCEADHPTAEEVKLWADRNFPKLSLATVYNTLRVLVEGKLLRELRLPHSDKVMYDNNVENHFHFLDEDSGKLFDLHPDQVQVLPKLGRGFEIDSVDVVFKGKRR